MEDPEEATARRAVVLQDLVETEDITQEEADAADAAPLAASPRTQAVTLTAGLAPHFVEWVREQTIDAVGEDAVYGSGLRVITTLDLNAQAAAEKAVADRLTDPAGPQAALVALDTDGAIRAHVGGRDFDALQVDLVRGGEGGGSGRQPGSAFKPFVLEAALQRGVTLADRYAAPASIDLGVGGAPWTVGNYGGEAFGDLTVAEATADSVNTVYAQMLAEVGPDAVAQAAHDTGIDADLDPVPAVPGYATVVWMGYPEPRPMDDVQGRSVTGGSFPAQIWAAFMEAAMEGRDEMAFPDPPRAMLEPRAIPLGDDFTIPPSPRPAPPARRRRAPSVDHEHHGGGRWLHHDVVGPDLHDHLDDRRS